MTYNYRDPNKPASIDPNRRGGGLNRYPGRRNITAWAAEYRRRRATYLGEPYTSGEVKDLHLFRLENRLQTEDVLRTRRITRDYKYVCDVDASALLGGGLNLSAEDAGPQAFGDRTWRWSRIPDHLHRWCVNHAVEGDTYWEVARVKRGAATVVQIVRHQTDTVDVWYDPTGTFIERAVIMHETEPSTRFDEGGSEVDVPAVLVVRELLPDRVNVWLDDVKQPDGQSGAGAHGLGVVPLVHVGFAPFCDPEHSLGAGHAIDETLCMLDSILTQLQAIGNRYADPIPVFMGGFMASADVSSWRQGSALNMPPGSTVDMLTGDLSNYGTLADVVQAERDALRSSLPEFVFAEAGSAASGAALTTRAHAFSMKIEPVRQRFWRGLALATGYALAMSAHTMFDADTHDVFTVQGGPVFPADRKSVLEMLRAAMDLGLLRPIDAVKRLQSMDIIGKDEDPEEYLALAEADMHARDERVAALLAQSGMTASEGADAIMRDLPIDAEVVEE